MAKKGDFQKDFGKFMEQAKEKFREIGKEVNVLAKKSEKEIVKASKTGKIHIDIMGLGVQKEKVYYDIGKKIVSLNVRKKLGISEIESHLKKLRKLESDTRKKKRELSGVRKEKK